MQYWSQLDDLACPSLVQSHGYANGRRASFGVLNDCDLDKAAADASDTKFTSTGQDCLSVNRIFVQRSIFDAFCEKFTEAAAALEVCSGFEGGVSQEPLMNEGAVAKREVHVEDDTANDARVRAGGGKMPKLGLDFFAPTALADVMTEMAIFRDEIYGRLAAMLLLDTEAKISAAANDTQYDLLCHLSTNDMCRIWRTGEALEYVMRGDNDPSFTSPPIPFDYHKQSCLSREGIAYSLDDYTENKCLSMEAD